ncbi:hypothetical protein [Natronosalvus amylolyticus]|uniref:hypothetical protein n=1 Tax=Natronosalvus amylolyticus TaxID=2961994 RepID=UPI0020CA1BD9|nr:hypothetical protein [Natronosalvus amylolyticus]
MSLVFENELYDMTETATEILLENDLPWRVQGDVVFEEVPYAGFRTDIVTARFDTWACARRRLALDHLTPLPDERKYRRSYRTLQRLEPVTRAHWIHEDSTYATEQTCREVWDWLVEHNYLTAIHEESLGGQQRLPLNDCDSQPIIDDHTPMVTVRYPDILTIQAFELKPRDWETALRQAIRADSYADTRWVIMDAGAIGGALEEQKQFHDSGVGLMSLDRNDIEIHVWADSVHPPDGTTRQLLNERALANVPQSVQAEIDERYQKLEEKR